MPVLGVAICLCTFLLSGLSLPFVFKERALVAAAPGGSAFSPKSQARVASLLPTAGLPAGTDLAALATAASLREGRGVLLGKCVQCHDLKTVIAKPRIPSDWVRTVERMGEKPTLGDELTLAEQHQVSAFLIAITPDLQKSAKAKREDQAAENQARTALAASEMPGAGDGDGGMPAVDPVKATETYEKLCSQCHELSDVTDEPPEDADEVDAVVARMVDNGLEASADDLGLVKWYLTETFVKKK
jgi:cytochrome c5